MIARFVYNGKIIAKGTIAVVPAEGSYVEIQETGNVYQVTATMFKVVLNGEAALFIYLGDTFPHIERFLTNYQPMEAQK